MITSTSNSQIKEIMQLQKKSKTRWQQRVFVVEGPRMVSEAPKDRILAAYLSESFAAKEPDWIRRLGGIPYEIVSDSVFASVSETRTPQGILCLVRMPEYTIEDLLVRENPHLLLLESIQDPGNLGTMLRTGEGAGIDGIIMNRQTVDLFNPKTVRATMGSLFRVPYLMVEDLAEIIAILRGRGIRLYAAHLDGSKNYDQPDYTKGTAFLIGNEGNGLREETASLADTYIRIPMEGKVESLNAAIAATLLMYEVHRQRSLPGQSSSIT